MRNQLKHGKLTLQRFKKKIQKEKSKLTRKKVREKEKLLLNKIISPLNINNFKK